MKTYEHLFVNPLLAMSFIDGVNFLDDENLIISGPIRESDAVWKVTIIDKEPEPLIPKSYPCGICMGCVHHDVCIEEVNAACLTN